MKFVIFVSALALFLFVSSPVFAFDEKRVDFMAQYIEDYWVDSGWSRKIEKIDNYSVLFEQRGKITVIDSGYSKTVATWFEEAAEEYDIDPLYLVAIAQWESGFRVWAKGDGGKSYGLMQIRKPSHISQFNNEKTGFGDFDDPYQRVRYSAYKISQNGHNIWTVWKKGSAKTTYKKLVASYQKE